MYIYVHVYMCVHISLDPTHKSLGMRLCVYVCVSGGGGHEWEGQGCLCLSPPVRASD